jgi:outer membrane biosynthesis protein TonB
MPRPPALLLSIVLGAVFATGLASCGDGEEGGIPPETAEAMLNQLESARAALSSGDCERVQGNAGTLQAQISQLPTDVDPQLRSALTEGANHLADLAALPETCQPAPAEEEAAPPPEEEVTPPPEEEKPEKEPPEEGEEGEDGEEEQPPPEEEPPGQPPGPPTDGDSGTDGETGGTGEEG